MNYIVSVLKKSLVTTTYLLKIMLPMMLLSRVLELAGVASWLSEILSLPLAVMGLPGEAGIIWAVTLLTSLYGGVGVLITLLPADELTLGQLSILSSVMLFAHGLPVEQAVVRAAGASAFLTGSLRVFAAIAYGISANYLFTFFGIMQEPVNISWIPETSDNDGWDTWIVETIKIMILMLTAITVINFLIDFLERVGVLKWLSRQLEPLMKITGQNPVLAPMTTIGLLLGLSYGSGLIIQKVKEVKFSRRDLFMSLSFLSLLHSLIEDTLIMIFLGADIWVILFGRMLFSILMLAILSKIVDFYFFKERQSTV
ncbi:hypothetical protein JF541_19415 [Marinobacter hydrocarbonoclasticus]|uniref:nucleoside recognition domain-containing protein n=1 Tax=Marinobacter nauticus TaxID=2743 RepID=UPI001A8D6BAF|nr:nucleoside recognition domain-containing protein [Marinobacter nauticus]MBN8241327.1 hypothetical protein [Marinobacter nauticus]